MDIALVILIALAAAGVGGAIGYVVAKNRNKVAKQELDVERARIVEAAQIKAKEVALAAKDEAIKVRDDVETELKRRRGEWQREEERLNKRREELDQKLEKVDQRERKLNQRQSQMDKTQNDLEKEHAQIMIELERSAGMGREEAKQELLKMVEAEARGDMARVLRQVEAEIKEQADQKARELVVLAVQRLATEQAAEVSTSLVPLPNDEMKGRIIGRNGRNIRAIERATGVDIVVDDTPEAVTLSSFDAVRREIAKIALSKMIQDGRIHPTRIEKLVEDAEAEVERVIKDEGERAAIEAGVPGLHPEIIKLLGRLRFRTSYGQNQHYHAIESAHIAGILAAELGADVKVAKIGGLLHDIGKAIDHEFEGTHAKLGAEFAKRFGINNPKVLNAIAAHHHEVPQESIEAIIVEMSDAISGSRPGARRENVETFLKRVRELEDIATAHKGVAEAYAIQAGREIRVVVRPEDIDDLASIQLSKDIAKKIEETMQYPGQIKVTVLRETRATEYAK
ncbi:MAG TPA: ribonuclease Y [Anaerolineae bacterium]|nr:ribonuclease Y [Anaerolineae bacterium]